jgi:Zn-dependent M28 family amino/carboxypeptidase
MRIARLSLLGAFALLASGAGLASAPENESIRRDALRADLFFLAGDAFRGRLSGTPENTLATEFVASRFDRLGLKSIVRDGSFFFRYSLISVRPGELGILEAARGDSVRRFAQGEDFHPHRFSISGSARGPLAFAGFGISAPELGRDDYQGRDVRGRVVLVFDDEPGENDPESPFDGLVRSEHTDPLRKALAAQKREAVALLIVSDVHNHPGPENFEAIAITGLPAEPTRLERYLLQDRVEQVRIPVAQISRAAAAELVQGSGLTLEELARAAESPGKGAFPDNGVIVSLATDVRRHVIPDRSVVAMLEGSDPKLKGEYVVVSAHHDHNGVEGELILNGADDNGSGVVGLIAIAEAYARAAAAGNRPRRSILFASFNSEERGLLGSRAFVEKPPVLLSSIVAVLNMDMIGRDEEVPEGAGIRFRGLPVQTAESNRNTFTLLGQGRSSDLTALIDRANSEGGVALTIKKGYDNNISNLIRRSDHWPFLQHGVPGVWFHTGLHPDYHTANDRPEKVRYDKMERIARLVHQASWDLAQRDDRPRLNPRVLIPSKSN